MPNHVQNEIRFNNSEACRNAKMILCSEAPGDPPNVDFNRLIRMPAHQPDVFFADGGIGRKEEKEYGDNNWFAWSVKFWGTKWGAYETVIGTTTIRFQTAWSAPLPIIYAFAARFDSPFFWDYADEDVGRNFGRFELKDGDLLTHPFGWADYSDDARRFAGELRYGMTGYRKYLEERAKEENEMIGQITGTEKLIERTREIIENENEEYRDVGRWFVENAPEILARLEALAKLRHASEQACLKLFACSGPREAFQARDMLNAALDDGVPE